MIPYILTEKSLTAVIDGKGRVIAQLGLGKTGHLDHALPPALPRTLYARTGDYLALVAIMGLFLAVITLRRFPKRSPLLFPFCVIQRSC